MVKEALHERSSMLKTAPHLTHAIPIMLPVYEYVLILIFNSHVFIISYIYVGGGKFLTTGLVLKHMIL